MQSYSIRALHLSIGLLILCLSACGTKTDSEKEAAALLCTCFSEIFEASEQQVQVLQLKGKMRACAEQFEQKQTAAQHALSAREKMKWQETTMRYFAERCPEVQELNTFFDFLK